MTHRVCIPDNVAPAGEEQVELLTQFQRAAYVERDVRTTAMFFWRTAG
jgi:hypothetical protein